MDLWGADLGDLIVLVMVLLMGIGFRIAVWHRTRKANESTGCLACHEETLEYTDHGMILCTSCGYEGDPQQGGHISYEEVKAFTGDRDHDELF